MFLVLNTYLIFIKYYDCVNNPIKPYTAKRAAELLGVSTNTLYKYLDEGKIKALRFSKRSDFRIPETEIARLLEEKVEHKKHTPFLDIFKKIF